MAKATAGTSAYKSASFIYFWLGLLTGALIIIMTIILQSAMTDGQASIFSGSRGRNIANPQAASAPLDPQDVKTITNPQTKTEITNPQTTNSITNPQTKTGITNPQTKNGITNPQTKTN